MKILTLDKAYSYPTVKTLAKTFGVHKSTVLDVYKRRTWV